MQRSGALSLVVLLCLLVGPLPLLAGTSSPATYHVHKGDNLSVIAQRFGTTVKTLKSDNNLRNDVIHIGQALRVAHPFRGQNNKRVQWGRPLRHPGPVLRPFGPYQAGGILMPRTGTDLASPIGTSLYSPAIGVVRHSGPMDGFGHILIIEHPGRYATVLAPCDPASLTVEVGQAILRGEPLGKTGSPPDSGAKPYVHIELRRDDKAIAPDRLIK
ncbi:MAG: LysM peptidoglycan-binding domain-containing M23 family metallopeptidase [Candidatus Krumholzibacteria bacterium]|nr:LysM peptidoglycan-binding domain-containing M23 family metallopeptidase [Candidatus Krumholzibacteria bacterium]